MKIHNQQKLTQVSLTLYSTEYSEKQSKQIIHLTLITYHNRIRNYSKLKIRTNRVVDTQQLNIQNNS